MTVHLVNPSHLSFGVGVITPRWLFVLAAATPASYGQPQITDETLEPFDLDSVQPATSWASGFTPATRFAATRSERRAEPRRDGRLRRHPRDAVSRRGARARRRARRRSRRRRRRLADRPRHAAERRAAADVRGRTRRRRSIRPGALGSAARRAGTCGARCRRFAAVRSIARSARSGARTGRSPASAASTASSPRSSSCAAAGSASWRLPTTTSIRSRSRTWRWRSVRETSRGSNSCGRCAPSDSS